MRYLLQYIERQIHYSMKKEKYIYERNTKKGSKYFQIQIAFKDHLGQKKVFNQSVQFKDFGSRSLALKYAMKVRDEALFKIQSETLVLDTPLVSDLFDKKFELMPVSISTKKSHKAYYNKGINKFGATQIGDISVADIQRSVNEYALTHHDNSIIRYVCVWRDLFKTAMMLGYNISDKTQLIIVPKSKLPEKKRNVICSKEELDKVCDVLLNYAKISKTKHFCKMVWYMLQIGYYTGMRPAEILALNAEDITGSGITVNKAVGSSTTEELTIIPTKTKQSVRVVPVHPELRPILDQLLKEQTTSPLLTTVSGGLLDMHHVSDLIWKASMKAGVEFNAYMLRHGMATDLINQGESPRTVQDILGHANFSMSVEYARSSEEDREKAIDKRKMS